MATIDEDLGAIDNAIGSQVPRDWYLGTEALNRIRAALADIGHLEAAASWVRWGEPGFKREGDPTLNDERWLSNWLEAERARQVRKDGG